MSLLREVALAPDRCVVVVTHDSRIFGFADRIVSMEDGEVTDIREKSAPSPIPT
jgi:putative ABC transport system ATP-binding protein